MIIEITQYLPNKENRYYFNPSIICIDEEKDMYIGVYRYIRYNVKEKLHPWKVWSDGSTKFKEQYPDLFKIKDGIMKYHIKSESDLILNLNAKKHDSDLKKKIKKIFEYDSTGVFLFQMKQSKIEIKYNQEVVFHDMIQDARLSKVNDKIYLTYNGFITNDTNDVNYTKMLYREVYIDIENNKMYFGIEKEMLNNEAKQIEKNCVFNLDGNILYWINGDLIYYNMIEKKYYTKNIKTLNNIIKYYEDLMTLSLSTPVIKYGKNNLMIAHSKIYYMRDRQNKKTPFDDFLKLIDFSKIKKHGKYLYFMFFVLFDDNYNIISMSQQFIPTDGKSHLPYLLVFPSGLTYNKTTDDFIISYGEGDVSSKILILKSSDIDRLLIPIHKISPSIYPFGFYNVTDKTFINKYPRVAVLGYYHQKNTGDDGFKIVFDFLKEKYLPKTIHGTLSQWDYYVPNDFPIEDLNNYSLIIVGGGDIVTPYFMKHLEYFKQLTLSNSYSSSPIRFVAVSIGLPYPADIHYCSIFDDIYIRNNRDLPLFKETFPDKNITYYPDLCYLLPKLYPLDWISSLNLPIKSNFYNIGIFLARTYFNPNYEKEYLQFITRLSDIFKSLSNSIFSNKPVHFYFIPFCLNNNNPYEDDNIINKQITSLLHPSTYTLVDIPPSYNHIYYIYSLISCLDYSICSRFHAHIFSVIHNVPFTSITSTRKCFELMHQLDLSSNLIQLETNSDDVPITLNVPYVYNQIIQNIQNAPKTKSHLISQFQSITKLMEHFIIQIPSIFKF